MIQVIVLMKLYLQYDREVQIQDVNLQRKNIRIKLKISGGVNR
jgi:predicted transport protein